MIFKGQRGRDKGEGEKERTLLMLSVMSSEKFDYVKAKNWLNFKSSH